MKRVVAAVFALFLLTFAGTGCQTFNDFKPVDGTNLTPSEFNVALAQSQIKARTDSLIITRISLHTVSTDKRANTGAQTYRVASGLWSFLNTENPNLNNLSSVVEALEARLNADDKELVQDLILIIQANATGVSVNQQFVSLSDTNKAKAVLAVVRGTTLGVLDATAEFVPASERILPVSNTPPVLQ